MLIAVVLTCLKTPSGDLLETAPPENLPSFAVKAGMKGQEVYRYAAPNGEILQYIPGFCGCGSIGHRALVLDDIDIDGPLALRS